MVISVWLINSVTEFWGKLSVEMSSASPSFPVSNGHKSHTKRHFFMGICEAVPRHSGSLRLHSSSGEHACHNIQRSMAVHSIVVLHLGQTQLCG